jgi:hypothetical protein
MKMGGGNPSPPYGGDKVKNRILWLVALILVLVVPCGVSATVSDATYKSTSVLMEQQHRTHLLLGWEQHRKLK